LDGLIGQKSDNHKETQIKTQVLVYVNAQILATTVVPFGQNLFTEDIVTEGMITKFTLSLTQNEADKQTLL